MEGLCNNKTKNNRCSVVNYKLVTRILGVLLWIESGMFAICAAVSLWYHEKEYIDFVSSILLTLGVGGLMILIGTSSRQQLGRRDGYCVVGLSWVLFSLFGMLPFYLSGHIPSITDAFFETMSGFTTTGATILNDIESLPKGLLFWRSLTQWIGGLGIVFFTLAILPNFGSDSQQLFLSEATGITHHKTHPQVQVMARWLWTIYLTLTFLETLLLLFGGMSLFDAVCHSLTSTATGGFSTKQDSIAYWNSPFIEYVVAFFMLFSGINFSLFYMGLKGNLQSLLKDEELHWYLKSIGFITLVITVALIVKNGYGIEEGFRKAFFQVVSIHTSCGFATDDYNLWPHFTWMLLIIAMLSGGCTGSTGGGIKSARLLILMRNIMNQFKQILHPRAVLPVRINHYTVDTQLSATVMTFIITYMLCILLGWIALMAMGLGLTEAMSTAVSAMGNVGPGIGAFGPAYSWAAIPDLGKWLLAIMMLIGRLEMFGVLLLFYRGLWRNK